MAGLLYFFAGRSTFDSRSPDLPPDLVDVIGDASLTYAAVRNGPKGLDGVVVTAVPWGGGYEARCGIYPGQVWQPASKDAPYWIGYERARPPGPLDLARPRQACVGHPVELSSGNSGFRATWHIPPVLAHRSQLPRRYRLDEEGEPKLVTEARYHAIQAEAEKWAARVWTPEECEPYTYRDQLDYAVSLLAINYRLGRSEVLALEMLSVDDIMPIVRASLDIPAIVAENEALKKTIDTPSAGD